MNLRCGERGLHEVTVRDGADYTRITWPDVPVVVASGLESQQIDHQFRGSWTMYIYVPKGTKEVAGWSARSALWAPRTSGKLLDGDGKDVVDFSLQKDGWFRVPVPEGQDGRVWCFSNCIGQRLLASVPPYLTVNPKRLLLPREVAEKDFPSAK